MKMKRILIIMISVFIFIIDACIIISIIYDNNESNKYKNIINKIDNKESFNILITSNESEEITEVFDYYKSIYSFEYEQIEKDLSNDLFQILNEKILYNVSKNDGTVFVIVKKGAPVAELIGTFSEKDLKELLIDNNIIDKKYQEIDNVMYDDFYDYYNKTSNYSILFINYGDKESYKYRKLLVKNKIKSVVIYTGGFNVVKIKELHDKLGTDEEIYEKTPVVVNIKNKKISNYYTKVKLKDLLKKINDK